MNALHAFVFKEHVECPIDFRQCLYAANMDIS